MTDSLPIEYSELGWRATQSLNWGDVEQEAGRLWSLHKGLQFLIGDFLNYCEDMFGEKEPEISEEDPRPIQKDALHYGPFCHVQAY